MYRFSSIAAISLLIGDPALAQQQQDPAKLSQVYRQQREQAADGIAACSVMVSDLQAKIADLEKKLAAAKPVDPVPVEK